ncbi:hypothetical protein Q5P01_016434 [Channa striata]|uniref:Uncharacterized protein n=1 Tax=Channa striata TaxID=64152 RepID=A0AA88ME33_CHASR|nr:hypothetical protein Q5P01_016434 [Channa striata]
MTLSGRGTAVRNRQAIITRHKREQRPNFYCSRKQNQRAQTYSGSSWWGFPRKIACREPLYELHHNMYLQYVGITPTWREGGAAHNLCSSMCHIPNLTSNTGQ